MELRGLRRSTMGDRPYLVNGQGLLALAQSHCIRKSRAKLQNSVTSQVINVMSQMFNSFDNNVNKCDVIDVS